MSTLPLILMLYSLSSTGCESVNALLTGLPDKAVTASSSTVVENTAKNAQLHLSSHVGWRPEPNDPNPSLEVDFGALKQVEGILISTDFEPSSQSSIDFSYKLDQSEFLSISPTENPSRHHLEHKLRYESLVPVIARHFRMSLHNWNHENGVKWSLFGCPAGDVIQFSRVFY